MGVFIFLRKSGDQRVLLLSGVMLLIGVTVDPGPLRALATAQPHWLPLVLSIGVLGFVSIPAFFFVFPNGHFVPRWTVAIALLFGLFVGFGNYISFLPTAAAAWLRQVPETLTYAIGLAVIASMIWAPLYRYRRMATPVERQQTKWVILGTAVSMTLFFLTALTVTLPDGDPQKTLSPLTLFVQILGWDGSFLLVPVFVAIAILRYRLWDIDVLIRRTLVYSALTALLALVYFGSILVLQNLFRTLTGQAQGQLVTVLSTLAIAALFVPLRGRVQAWIDRRFYRQKYDAARILAAFAASARDEVALDQITERLVGVVDQTMRPAHVGLWLKGRVAAPARTPPGAVPPPPVAATPEPP